MCVVLSLLLSSLLCMVVYDGWWFNLSVRL